MPTLPDSGDSSIASQAPVVEAQAHNDAPILEIEAVPVSTYNVVADAGSASSAASGPLDFAEESILALPPLAEVQIARPAATKKLSTAANNASRSSSLSNFERYNLGVQLLQIRPIWLMLSGFVFVSFIVFCSWFVRTDGQASSLAMSASSLNYSTNRSDASETAPPATNEPEIKEEAHEVATRNASLVSNETETKQAPSAVPVETPSVAQTAKVEPPAPKVEPPARVETPVQPAVQGAGKFTVQVGSYNDKEQAEARVASLQSAGFEARAVSVEIPKRGTWYRVQAGRFASRDEATRFGAQLRVKGAAETVLVAETQAN